MENVIVAIFLMGATAFEWFSGRAADGKKTQQDWKMAGICLSAMVLIQRPAVYFGIFLLLGLLIPQYQGALTSFEAEHFWLALFLFLMLEELTHGFGHWICHVKPFQNKSLRRIQAFYKVAHRPHHFSGSNEGKGELSATQTFVEGWAYWFIMPNYWFQYLTLYLGLYQVFFVGLVIKGLWAVHNHTNWNYDLYFHNHQKAWVRKVMMMLSHILIFPTQHHAHHARGPHSAKNLQNMFAFYDWLLWKTLVVPTEKPAIYGWRQSEKEAQSASYRFFNLDLDRYMAAPVKKTS